VNITEVKNVPIRRMNKPEGTSPFDPATRDQISHYNEMVPGFQMTFYFPDEQLFGGVRGRGAPLTDEQVAKRVRGWTKWMTRQAISRRNYVVSQKEN
jgi:hypothetical protein